MTRCCARIRHAGSVFVGPFSPEAAGDYASGPNHVLPTSGAARLRGGLSVMDFVKVISVQQLSAAALARLAPAITTLARAEGLEAHARSVEVRTVASRNRPDCPRASSRPREAVLQDGAVFAAHRGPRGQAAAGFQREHRGLLAARDRISARAAAPPAGWRSIPNTAKRSRPRRILPREAGAVPLHQRHRRGHSGFHQHLRG